MQKADLSNLGTLYLMDIETGETTPWDGITEITYESSEEYSAQVPPEVVDKMNEAAVSICVAGQKIHDKLLAMIEEQSTIIKDLRDAIVDTLPDDKTPNPIYIPKHIQHRKRGRK